MDLKDLKDFSIERKENQKEISACIVQCPSDMLHTNHSPPNKKRVEKGEKWMVDGKLPCGLAIWKKKPRVDFLKLFICTD
jgi:hypothetical protein